MQPEVSVEVSRLVEALAADVAAEGFLPGVDAVVSLQHADRGEALATHRAAVGFLLGVPAHVDLQLAGKAEALPTLLTAVPPLDARTRRRWPGRHRLQGSRVLHLQQVDVMFSIGAKGPSELLLCSMRLAALLHV